jgi:hypothetical protein
VLAKSTVMAVPKNLHYVLPAHMLIASANAAGGVVSCGGAFYARGAQILKYNQRLEYRPP